MYEGLYRWMKEHLFVLERKVLLKLEKDLRKTKKFKDNGQTLFKESKRQCGLFGVLCG